MEHHFSKEIAIQYGVDVAIFLHNIAYWLEKNIVNNKHKHQDKFWTYNTQKAWINLFPYWTRQNLRTIIGKAIKEGLLLTGNFNPDKSDKTHWYALTDKGMDLFPDVKILLTHQKECDSPESNGWNQPMSSDAASSVVNINHPLVSSNQALVDSNHSTLVDSNQCIYRTNSKPDNKHKYQKPFSNFQNQKPKQSSGYADVTKRSDSWGAPPPETQEEANRKFKAMMQGYGKAIELAPRARKAG